jgi:AraC-like DNA-binding protein
MAERRRHSPLGSRSWRLPSLPALELFRASGLRHRYSRHSHDGLAIGVFEDGIGGTSYRGSTSYIVPGRIVAMNPDEPHTGFAADDRGLTYRMIYAGTPFFRDVLRLAAPPWFPDVCIRDDGCARTLAAAHRLLDAGVDELEAESRLIEALAALALRHGRSQAARAPLREPGAIARAKELLRAHCTRNVSVAEAAATAHLSPAHFIRCFRRAVGMPPHAWQLQQRVDLAKPLLAGGRPPADVALELGFADQSHFTRRFRAVTGLTPGAYAASAPRAAASARERSTGAPRAPRAPSPPAARRTADTSPRR